jgi:hypothetical protein
VITLGRPGAAISLSKASTAIVLHEASAAFEG